jgi:N-glycosylase/DNA lyase
MIVRLPLPSDFHFDAVVRSHGWYDLPPFAYDREREVLQTWVSRGTAAASLAFRVHRGRLEAQSEGLDRAAIAAAARRIFSLDVSWDGFARSLASDARLARALARGGGRMLRAPTLFEDAVKMLLTTNCSWAATKGMVTRLIAEAGAEGRAFPTPEAVAALRLSALKSRIRCGYRAGPLAHFARRVASGRLDLAPWERRDLPAEEVRARILAQEGFGPYASEGLLRILGRHDFLALDSWIRQKYRRLYPGPAKSTDRAIARRYARYGSNRGLALWLDMTRDWHEQKEEVWP